MTLENRFFKFLETLPEAENIDHLAIPQEHKDSQKGDFFLFGRRVIVEVKTLQADPEGKVEETIEPLRVRPEMPVFYGRVEVSNILNYFPEKEAIEKKIYERTSRSIEQAVRSADKQISATRRLFCTPDAFGILIILNESVEFLAPELIVRKTGEMFVKSNDDGTLRYPNIAGAVIFTECHVAEEIKFTDALPFIMLEGPSASAFIDYQKITEALMSGWAAFNGVPLIKHQDNRFMPFLTKSEKEKSQATRLARSELWERNYRNSRYLATFTDDQLMKYGNRLIAEVAPCFLKGGEQKDFNKTMTLVETFAHFNVEMNMRGLDMRLLRRS